uniref:Cadherin domain-containing protein n=1 Tax=Timema shepardi TaxID=629360 RepID=A0A7R9AXL0_TIMSH|nr:unnamed protein product [Timema shepardi]
MFLYVVTESSVRYKITGGNLEDVFDIKETTGAIFVSGPLDYETRKKVRTICPYSLQRQGDHGRHLYVRTARLRDQEEVYNVKGTTGAIFVSGPLDYETRKKVRTICPNSLQRQGDDGCHICVRTTRLRDHEEVYNVKETTGVIFVSGPLDYETRKKYELKLTASNKLKETTTTVVVHVKDLNDNPPLFERPTYRTQITEDSPPYNPPTKPS